jgi:hypothetical protein
MARAFDAAGNDSPAQITVTVSNAPRDTTPPAVVIATPVAGAVITETVNITADPSDDVGISRVDFYVDGIFEAVGLTEPYIFAWDTTQAANGAHVLVAQAFDTTGNMCNSSQINVQIANTIMATDLNMVRVFPNPFYPYKGVKKDITFDTLPAGARIRAYTFLGELIWDATTDASGKAGWDGRNKSGQQVASGVYIVRISKKKAEIIRKVSIIK